VPVELEFRLSPANSVAVGQYLPKISELSTSAAANELVAYEV
jgi:hypothetical protein